jgi:succinate-semialdehyde dehydrogenase/glutarate-semialdehyde dehydrogenase
MELGGSDPFIVLENASVEKAVEIAIKSRLANAGQVCFSAKRFLIHEKHFAAFKDLLVKKLKNVEIGNPSDEKTQLGPLARSDLVTNLESQIQKAQQQGAILLYGGKRLQGNFF